MDEDRTEFPPLARRAALALALAAAPGCRTYAPAPLDPAGHDAAWRARTPAAEGLRAFLDRVDARLAADAAAFDPADGLTLREGRLVALAFQPELRLARLRAGVAAAGAAHAGRWADPELSLDLLRVAEDVPDPWIAATSLAFELPLGGRRAAARDLAAAELHAAEARVREAEWRALHELEEAWIAWSAAGLRVEETERLVAAMEAPLRTAAELAEAGELHRTSAGLLAIEAARWRAELGRLRGELRAAAHELHARMGLAPDAPVVLAPSFGLDLPAARGDAVAPEHPRLARLRAEHAAAEEALRAAIAAQRPDLTLGPALEEEEGETRLGLVAALPLPLWNANRRAIAEAEARRALARGAYEAAAEELAGRRAAAAARAAALADTREELERALVPLVDRQLADALELVRLGEGSGLVLLESLSAAHDVKLELIETRAAEARARAALRHATGPPHPPEDPVPDGGPPGTSNPEETP